MVEGLVEVIQTGKFLAGSEYCHPLAVTALNTARYNGTVNTSMITI
jgi:hypothetical protein